MSNITEMKKDAIKAANEENERGIRNDIDCIVSDIIKNQRTIATCTRKIQELQKKMSEIEVPKEITLDILG